jgi:tetratricopeptide (TPR) repeat protein
MRYLQLAVWPASQVFDYGTPIVPRLGPVLPEFLILLALALATGWALYRHRSAGFIGAGFFLLLAPSSSFIPVATQTIAEHRMYLPLAAVVGLVVFAGHFAIQRTRFPRLGFLIVPLLALTLGAVTFARNEVYRSALTLWQDTTARRPENPRAHNNLGLALSAAGRTSEAIAAFERAIALQPNHAFAHFNLGTALLIQQRFTEAVGHFESALAADPAYVSARLNLGRGLAQLGRKRDAIEQYRIALSYDDSAQDVRTNLAALLIEQRELAPAEAMLRTVLAAQPGGGALPFRSGS